MLAAIISLLVGGFIVGALARFAVPGPDPLPIWGTVLLGIGGGLGAGFFVPFVVGAPEGPGDPGVALGYFVSSVIGASVLLIVYRWGWQGRSVTGPSARRLSTGDPLDELSDLIALKKAGKIDAAEFERRKAAVVARI